jgi:hypothetical protein
VILNIFKEKGKERQFPGIIGGDEGQCCAAYTHNKYLSTPYF